jgi:hypothetical protein
MVQTNHGGNTKSGQAIQSKASGNEWSENIVTHHYPSSLKFSKLLLTIMLGAVCWPLLGRAIIQSESFLGGRQRERWSRCPADKKCPKLL